MNILYSDNRGKYSSSKEELSRIAEKVKDTMEFGESIVTGGNVHCKFYYGNSPIGFANVMTWEMMNLLCV